MVVCRVRNAHKRKYALICLCIVGFVMYKYLGRPAGGRRITRKVGLSANSSQLTLEGQPFHILGGSIHYFRVPRAYWRDRLLKMKACGINTLTTAYLNLADELGLWVILRPGPYISSELDLGGLPSWLLRDGSMRLRTTYPGFTEAVNIFFDKLIPKVVPLQFKKGGPIIAVQVENEYGSFAKDESYMFFIKEALQSRGISELLFTSDNHNTLKSGGVQGGTVQYKHTHSTRTHIYAHTAYLSYLVAIRSVKLQKLNQKDLQDLNAIQPSSPTMVMDYWTGGYDVWGELHHVLPPEDTVSTVREILRRGMSVNLYMFHGGSSFGFMSGALADPSYKALVPSYDYDAPLSEAGEYTPKYHLLRDLFSRYNRGDRFPDMPALHYREAYEPAIMYQHLSLWDALSFTEGPFKSRMPVNMENLPVNNGNGQSYGYTLYETTITSGGILKSGDNVRDRALVFVDRSYIGLFKRQNLELAVPDGKAPWKTITESRSFPGFYMGRLFAYGYPSDTFMKLPGWEKGVVFINGMNLGRYWSIGPQQTLYIPGPFLNSGINQIILFEEQEGDFKVYFEDTPDLGMAADIH
ncbi:Beta-galactosidase-1-like protein 2 [Nibea albiflora]|uniref:Beta-galactosidase-1-like protein 2 n=1 Tax=Nibea albiflora TaxID=240163 RepID=A0ACB7F2F6_NIBAL|nr:Beta-galactosidase-1-like protein 2 [Nibea albiflora]